MDVKLIWEYFHCTKLIKNIIDVHVNLTLSYCTDMCTCVYRSDQSRVE